MLIQKAWIVVFIVLAVMVAGLLGWMVYLYYRQPAPETNTSVQVHHITRPVETKIVREHLPARVDTVYINNEPHPIARYSETIEKEKTKVDLSIAYDERLREFSVDTKITSLIDSVFVEKEILRTIEKKPKFLGLMAGVQVGAGDGQLANAGLDVGVKFVGKYSLSAFVNSDRIYGVRFGVDF